MSAAQNSTWMMERKPDVSRPLLPGQVCASARPSLKREPVDLQTYAALPPEGAAVQETAHPRCRSLSLSSLPVVPGRKDGTSEVPAVRLSARLLVLRTAAWRPLRWPPDPHPPPDGGRSRGRIISVRAAPENCGPSCSIFPHPAAFSTPNICTSRRLQTSPVASLGFFFLFFIFLIFIKTHRIAPAAAKSGFCCNKRDCEDKHSYFIQADIRRR